MTKNILWAMASVTILGINVSHAAFSPACRTPDGTWKDNCNPRHTLTQDTKGCTLIASCGGNEASYTWPLSTGAPIIDYMNGALTNTDGKRSCAAS